MPPGGDIQQARLINVQASSGFRTQDLKHSLCHRCSNSSSPQPRVFHEQMIEAASEEEEVMNGSFQMISGLQEPRQSSVLIKAMKSEETLAVLMPVEAPNCHASSFTVSPAVD